MGGCDVSRWNWGKWMWQAGKGFATQASRSSWRGGEASKRYEGHTSELQVHRDPPGFTPTVDLIEIKPQRLPGHKARRWLCGSGGEGTGGQARGVVRRAFPDVPRGGPVSSNWQVVSCGSSAMENEPPVCSGATGRNAVPFPESRSRGRNAYRSHSTTGE